MSRMPLTYSLLYICDMPHPLFNQEFQKRACLKSYQEIVMNQGERNQFKIVYDNSEREKLYEILEEIDLYTHIIVTSLSCLGDDVVEILELLRHFKDGTCLVAYIEQLIYLHYSTNSQAFAKFNFHVSMGKSVYLNKMEYCSLDDIIKLLDKVTDKNYSESNRMINLMLTERSLYETDFRLLYEQAPLNFKIVNCKNMCLFVH